VSFFDRHRAMTARRAGVMAGVAVIAGALVFAISVQAAGMLNPSAAATRCAHRRAVETPLGQNDVTFLGHYVPCVFAAERSQFGLTTTVSRPLSQKVADALSRFISLRYVSQGKLQAAHRALIAAMGPIAFSICRHERNAKGVRFYPVDADTRPPPVLTPLQIATALGASFGSPRNVSRAAHVVIGIAAQRGLVFRGDRRDGAAFAFVAASCTR
jgi:hypothetical protein